MNMDKFLIYLAKVVVGYVSFQIFDLPKSPPPLQNVLNDFENRKIIIYNNTQRECLFYEENGMFVVFQ